MVGLSPERELPIIGKIALGSLKNKLLILLPAALLLTAFAPFLIVPLLMLGGSYLAFEATEKIAELVLHDHGHEEQLVDAMADPADLEALQVKGAIRTDFILSAEIMAIALASLDHLSLATTAFALVAVALAITGGRLRRRRADREARRHRSPPCRAQQPGRAQDRRWAGARGSDHAERFVDVGTAAMLWVGGGILLHGLEELHLLEAVPHALHEWSARAGEATGAVGPVVEWLLYALGSAVAGLIVGGIIVVVVRRFVKHPEELIVD